MKMKNILVFILNATIFLKQYLKTKQIGLTKVSLFNSKLITNSIYCCNDRGPYFYSSNETNIFYIYNNNGSLNGYTNYLTNYNSFGKFDYDYEINNGQSQFSVVELEVFQILFDN